MLWYGLMLMLPAIYGSQALTVSLRMALTGLVGVVIYKLLKSRLARTRPFEAHAGIYPGTPPLDRDSFPSGHTLHAVGFTLVATAYYPELVWLLAPVAGLVALSRIVLGLHYPTDVVAGAAIGTALAAIGVAI